MLYRILFFIICFQSFSKEKIDSIYNYKIIELNNIGSPVSSFFPNFDFDVLNINYGIINSRLIENYDHLFRYNDLTIIPDSNIQSNLKYISSYNEGGLIMGSLHRPISNHSFINFYYNNLLSKGFFQYQENKFSNLGLEWYYYNKDTTYSFRFAFNSINGFYQENGGVIYESNLSNDLLNTYLTSSTIETKTRSFLFNQSYKFNSQNKLYHSFEYNDYNRLYSDPNPSSYHYSLTPFDFQIINYNRSTYFDDIKNKITINSNFFLKKQINYSIIHRLYFHELISNNKYGDFIFSISNFNNYTSKYNFSLNFCPLGYNKNNYDFRFSYNYDFKDIKNKFNFVFFKKRPNIFLDTYYTGFSVDWENDFKSKKVFSLKTQTSFLRYNLDVNFDYNRINNFLYFNNLASAVQFNNTIDYFHLFIKKKWVITDRFKLYQNIHFQKTQYNDNVNFDIIPIPLFLFNQKIKYDFFLFKKLEFSSSIDITFHSKYYANRYMPLNGVFYNQDELKIGGKPFLQGAIFMKKKNFNIGVLIENIHSLFFNEIYITPSYIHNDLIFRLYIDWKFLD